MTLESGERFGNYEIGESIGAGGMGEVYRAHDTTLERDVAIKVLPASFAEDAGRVERFEREAKTLAALNHPNIAQIYGLERSNGTTALVMELVEGPTLDDRITKGPLPADEALGIAMQIADALEAAHSQNIVHRDLKPANVKVRSDGLIKVLDFGIAKALAPENLTTGPQSPVMTTPATQAGVILGTAAYMSPEQAKGKPVDQRTDIWAFGCVLYEMLTGQLAFGAEDVPTTLARVIAKDTNLDTLPAAVSPAVRHTIRLCLQKDVRKRVRDIGDVKLALEGVFETPIGERAGTPDAGAPLWRRGVAVTVAMIVTGVVVGLAVWLGTRPEPRPVNRFAYALPEGQVLYSQGRSAMAISPDGREVVYNTESGLFLRSMGELEARLIPGSEPNSIAPVFSPDGRAVAYWAPPDQLKRIAISGGAPVTITSGLAIPFGVSWGIDGTIFLAELEGIFRVPANGGAAERVIEARENERIYDPWLLPDRDSVLFSVPSAGDSMQTVVQSLSTGERGVVLETGYDARYLPTGHLVYAVRGDLFAQAFDLDSLTVSGGAVPVVQGVLGGTSQSTGESNYDVSDDGTLVYVSGDVVVDQRTLVWVDRAGRETPLGTSPRSYTYPRLSPDGTKVALDVRDGENDIWIWDLTRRALTRLTFGPALDQCPIWSPDSRRIAFSSRGGTQTSATLLWEGADGTGPTEQLAESTVSIFCATSFLPDASGILAYTGLGGATGGDDVTLVRMGEGRATPLLHTAFGESNPSISPDGHWLAYSSDESGRDEIYVRPFPDVDAGRLQVSTGGGAQPLWAHSGRELFFRDGAALMRVAIQTDPSLTASNPEVLFEGDYFAGPGTRAYDVSADDERFLMIKAITAAQPQIIIVENWFEELERLVPTE